MSCQAAKRKLLEKERCKQNHNGSSAPEMSTLPSPIFRPRLGVNFHILLTPNWLWESSLSLLSLWCILFRIKLGLFRENVNLKKYSQPQNGQSLLSTFWHRLIYNSDGNLIFCLEIWWYRWLVFFLQDVFREMMHFQWLQKLCEQFCETLVEWHFSHFWHDDHLW